MERPNPTAPPGGTGGYPDRRTQNKLSDAGEGNASSRNLIGRARPPSTERKVKMKVHPAMLMKTKERGKVRVPNVRKDAWRPEVRSLRRAGGVMILTSSS